MCQQDLCVPDPKGLLCTVHLIMVASMEVCVNMLPILMLKIYYALVVNRLFTANKNHLEV